MPTNKETEMAAMMTFNLLVLFFVTVIVSGVAVAVAMWIAGRAE